ncbi:hypothetical protein GTY65_37490 [Streptomyces sp. SID8379]|uniref:hypothetical protein n=1 Tax=unclassified Streptomyces TaxID=2593676 RepID=UPI0004774D41|nr:MULTISPECIES: hypothetical protein [unclassified Streptomyces]MYW69717.1 hypothetical protein [Streptomyces sp. SID8379]
MASKKNASLTPAPDTVWLSRGRHLGSEPEQDVRRNLIALKAAGVLDDFLDLDPADAARSTVLHPRDADADPGPLARRLFEARWRVADDVTVRAQLTLYDAEARRKEGDGVTWVVAAEAERPWALDWPSPVTMFWPDSARVPWDHDTVAGLRLRGTNHLPKDADELRHQLRDCARGSWYLHVVVHEAMTPDARGQQPITPFLPPSLRHRVIEHRASPEQSQIADFALKRELSVRMPRGGAVVLPTQPPLPGYDAERAMVSNIFLDGSEPSELIARIVEFAALPRPLPADAEPAVARLRKGWHLLTPDEELTHAQDMVSKYADALEAMTKSRDAYKEAAEAAQSALTEARRGEGVPSSLPLTPPGTRPDGSPLSAITKAFGRFRDPNK